ncbi:MAG TPA: hypothetical protein VGN57_16015 [Pirellulaceae bacterium]|nr:hypothetical protein [Pirellulaceae bacterium]
MPDGYFGAFAAVAFAAVETLEPFAHEANAADVRATDLPSSGDA